LIFNNYIDENSHIWILIFRFVETADSGLLTASPCVFYRGLARKPQSFRA